ncbi:hypothetical protein FWK35_00032321 [Aphis craccivora]|uniref:Uncharacterized protein n=1 Tax=Aphis craccivora TaxID=307492 RepID=A0A6G0Y167_APHCR|nr:hypothetical protein FWK35_00032321 [Aphis craccivora]
MIIIIGFKFNAPMIYTSDAHSTKCTAERYPLAHFFFNLNLNYHKFFL